jgi:hypothetical protein
MPLRCEEKFGDLPATLLGVDRTEWCSSTWADSGLVWMLVMHASIVNLLHMASGMGAKYLVGKKKNVGSVG